MDAFHTFADWKAQSVQDGIEKLQNRVADYDQLRAQAEEMKAKINVCASEQAQREVDKKEVGTCIHLLPSKFQPLYFFLQLHFIHSPPPRFNLFNSY
jgi:hypothetical protein